MKKSAGLGWRIAGVVVPPLGTAYIRLVRRFLRWDWIGRSVVDRLLAERKPFIVAFWHGRILMMAPVTEEAVLPVHVIISNNKDGELIARLIGYFNGLTIRGSTRDRRKTKVKGGDAVLHSALERLNAGELIALTPDGPRGPRMRAQAGVAVMSARTGVPVVPFTYSTRSARLMNSWDRFMVPLPFGRGIYITGDPITPQGVDEAAIEAHRLAIETALNDITRQADEAMGRVPVQPA
jgi:lysophospholipid acyltransferase (LPLAT)-like uncharacterized protein